MRLLFFKFHKTNGTEKDAIKDKYRQKHYEYKKRIVKYMPTLILSIYLCYSIGSSRQQSRPNTTMGFTSRPTTAATSTSGKPPPRSTSAPVRSRQVRTPKVVTQGNGRKVKIEEGNMASAKAKNTKVAWDY